MVIFDFEQPVKLVLWEISGRLFKIMHDTWQNDYWLLAIISIITKQMTKDQDFPGTIKKNLIICNILT